MAVKCRPDLSIPLERGLRVQAVALLPFYLGTACPSLTGTCAGAPPCLTGGSALNLIETCKPGYGHSAIAILLIGGDPGSQLAILFANTFWRQCNGSCVLLERKRVSDRVSMAGMLCVSPKGEVRGESAVPVLSHAALTEATGWNRSLTMR